MFIWNVRGLNKKERRQDLKEHIATFKPSMVVLVETKVSPHNRHRVIKCIPRNWENTGKGQAMLEQ